MFSQIKLYLTLAAVVGAFGAGWAAQGWRLNAKIDSIRLGYQTALTTSINQARGKEQEWETKLNQERDNATKREIQLRKDADAAHAASDGLRSQLSDTARRIAQAPASACADAASAIGDLLQACSIRYRELGEIADRHTSDIETLIGSWPK
jgi:hypothetical protein